MKGNNKEVTKLEKLQDALALVLLILSAAVIVIAVLQRCCVIPHGFMAAIIPLLGAIALLQAILNWKNSRGVALLSLVASVFVFICAVTRFM